MDPQPSSSIAIGDRIKRSWSPPGRPTVNTASLAQATSSLTPLEASPHPSSVSGSSHSSPWLQQAPLTTSTQPVPFTMLQHPTPAAHADLTGQHAVSSSFPGNEWGNVFSSPLDPSTFAALAASGVLGPPNAGLPASISNRSHRSPHDIPPNMRPSALNTKDLTRSTSGQTNQGVPVQWPNVPSSYPSPPSSSQRASPTHLRSGSGSTPYVKRKPTVGNMSPYMNIRPSSTAVSVDMTDFDGHRLQGAGDTTHVNFRLLR